MTVFKSDISTLIPQCNIRGIKQCLFYWSMLVWTSNRHLLPVNPVVQITQGMPCIRHAFNSILLDAGFEKIDRHIHGRATEYLLGFRYRYCLHTPFFSGLCEQSDVFFLFFALFALQNAAVILNFPLFFIVLITSSPARADTA